MPERSFIHKEAKSMPGFKACKDRVALLLGGNIAGFKLKPLLIYRCENPRALNNVGKHTLPVYYHAIIFIMFYIVYIVNYTCLLCFI